MKRLSCILFTCLLAASLLCGCRAKPYQPNLDTEPSATDSVAEGEADYSQLVTVPAGSSASESTTPQGGTQQAAESTGATQSIEPTQSTKPAEDTTPSVDTKPTENSTTPPAIPSETTTPPDESAPAESPSESTVPATDPDGYFNQVVRP